MKCASMGLNLLMLHLVSAIAVVEATVATPAIAEPMSYLDNGAIRLGVDLGKGGTITWLSTSGAGVNVINSWDLGREVQQSYYSGPVNYGDPAPPWTNFPWNPIGAGDTFRKPATVLQQSNDGQTLYTKTAPLQWALDNVACECLMEQWITLSGNSVKVHNRFTNDRSDKTKYAAFGQELPAVYTNGTFWRLFTYSGSVPYTNGSLTQITGSPPNWSVYSATEHWAALVDDSGFGLGVFNAFASRFVGGFAGTPDEGGPGDFSTGYIAPNLPEILDWNIVYEYDYALVLGTLDQIRAFAVANRPDGRPDYQFVRDRQHFSAFQNTTDAGWPIDGALRVSVDQNDPQLIGPESWWQAQDMPSLSITAAYHTTGTRAQIFWSIAGQSFAEERSVRFTTIPDGNFHTYKVDLAASPNYQGVITGIRFDPTDGNDPNGFVDIASITWSSPPSSTPVVEYYNASQDHYFMTWVPGELAILDAGTTIKGWTRTGKTFPTYTTAWSGTSPVCRFYIPPAQGDSHFYGRGTIECNATAQQNPSFNLEDPMFMAMFLPDAGVCPANTTEVYRVFSNRADVNHRYMTDPELRDAMVALGWLAEGAGPNLVVMCAPAQSANVAPVFDNLQAVTVQGYVGPQQDPVISPDGLYLFFDSHNDISSTAKMYWAKRIDYKTFQFMGEVQGVNFPGEMTLRGNYDLAHNFYFVSTKFRNSCGMVAQGIFDSGSVTNIKPVSGICAPPPPPGDLNVTFDVAISPDGKTLHYSNAVVAKSGQPKSSRIAVATKNADGSFTPLPNSDVLFRNLNALASRVYNSAATPDGLAFFFSADMFLTGPAVYVATRASTFEPFGIPQRVDATQDAPQFSFTLYSFSEMGGVSPDGNYLYFHRVLSKASSQLYVLTRHK